MGSLPNLHELENVRRKFEQGHEISRREYRLREQLHLQLQQQQQQHQQNTRESSREREKLPLFLQSQLSYNPQLFAQTFVGSMAAPTTTTGITGENIGCSGTPNQIPRHHHRHSLTTRRVLRTRSSGATYNVWDDPMIEHMAAYSPISSRSHRINIIPPYQVQAALAASRRRESINSSIGANSIRRLLTINNRNCRHKIPSHVRTKIWKNFIFLAIAHGLICSILIPLIGLQGSNSLWHHKEKWINIGPNIGSILLSISFLISSGMCFLTTRIIRKIGYTILIVASYIGISLFLIFHLYPSIYTLIPAYIIFGITLGPAWVGKFALVVYFASKLSCSQHECNLSNTIDTMDEHKMFCNRDQKVRRLGRWYQVAQDLGIIFGAIIVSFVLACSSTGSHCFSIHKDVITINTNTNNNNNNNSNNNNNNNMSFVTTIPSETNVYNKTLKQIGNFYTPSPTTLLATQNTFSNEMYNHNEHGERICGSDLCPVWRITEEQAINGTFYDGFIQETERNGSTILIIIFLMFAIISLTLACLSGRVDNTFRSENVKGITDTIMFAGPMAYFIGTEQAYMLADFTKAFVSCSLGIQMVAGALIGMGIMQLIVSCTLSMLLRHTKRIVVIAAGFFFHACLLLVLSRWKPSKDDSALFYVIAASWGACNGMWETLLFALITLTHTNHVLEVETPLQALRFLGLGITFAAHGFLCENPKILILVIILVLSVPPYAMLEIRLETQRKAQMISL